MTSNGTCPPPVFIITGPPQGGKTTALKAILHCIEDSGYRIHGFIAEGLQEDGIRTGFDLMEIPSGRRTPLCRCTPVPGGGSWGRFNFFPEGLATGIAAMLQAGKRPPDLTVIDEVGPFELHGGIWADGLDYIVKESPRPLLWVVRSFILHEVITRWNLNHTRIFEVPIPEPVLAAAQITQAIDTWRAETRTGT